MAEVRIVRLTGTCVSAEPSQLNMSYCMEGRARDEGETKHPSKLTPEDNGATSQAKHMKEANGTASQAKFMPKAYGAPFQAMVMPVADGAASHDHPSENAISLPLDPTEEVIALTPDTGEDIVAPPPKSR